MSRSQGSMAAGMSFGNDPTVDNVQRMDHWPRSPPQWDFLIPQEMMFDLGEESAANSDFLLQSEQPNPFAILLGEPDLMSSAWAVDNDSSPSTNAEDTTTDGSLLSATNRGDNANVVQDEPSIQQQQQQQQRQQQQQQFEVLQPGPSRPWVIQGTLTELFPNVPREIFNLPTALSEYFFREVIPLYCTWDSKSNVMRNIVETTWQSSGALHHTIQSMAAACLCEDFPHLQSVARSEHAQALALFQSHKQSSSLASKNAMLLVSQLLGHTSSWLSPQNLATDMFRASCSLLNDISAEATTGSFNDPRLSFFSDAMDYWAMLLVYLTDSSQLGDYRRNASSVGPAGPAQTAEPHPYSGISHDMVRILTDTGILIFQYRKHMAGVKFMTENDLDVFKTALREARRLERILLANKTPKLSQFKDPGDSKTPLKHLESIDEAYRCTGLLQLYRVFPDLLSERYAPWDEEQLLRPMPADREPTVHERQVWLTKLAMHILGILRDIPSESHTRSAQPFVIVAVSSELRRDPQHLMLHQQQGYDESSIGEIPIDKTSIEVARARKFVGSRLAAYTHILPLRKSRVIFKLIESVWSAMDAGQQDVYWLDVAYEKKLGTMMG